jgi:transposase
MVHVIEDLAADWRRLDERIQGLSGEIEIVASQDPGCKRLMTVPGIGPIISSAMVAAIGSGAVFSNGRDFGAWLGLVPRQISTGDRTILGTVSKQGNRYLRVLFVQAAWVVLISRSGSVTGSSNGLQLRRAGCIPTCSPSRSPTSSPELPGPQ